MLLDDVLGVDIDQLLGELEYAIPQLPHIMAVHRHTRTETLKVTPVQGGNNTPLETHEGMLKPGGGGDVGVDVILVKLVSDLRKHLVQHGSAGGHLP